MDVSEDAFHYNLKQDMRASELVGDRRYGWRSYKNCFVGSETVSWIAHTRHCSYEEAEQIGQAMLDKGLFRPLQGDMKFENNFVFYRFQEDEPLPQILNEFGSKKEVKRIHPLRMTGELLCFALSLARFHEDDPVSLRSSREYFEFLQHLGPLKQIRLGELKENERIPFWVNLFNTLALHIGMLTGPPTSDSHKKNRFFSHHQYDIGGLHWSLLEIYEGVLRGNRRRPGHYPVMKDSDRRILHICITLEPIIHFLVSFLAVSCPRVAVLTSSDYENEIFDAVTAFIRTHVTFHPEKGEICLPAQFHQNRDDFPPGDAELLDWMTKYLSTEQLQDLTSMQLQDTTQVRIITLPFDWTPPRMADIKLSSTASSTEPVSVS